MRDPDAEDWDVTLFIHRPSGTIVRDVPWFAISAGGDLLHTTCTPAAQDSVASTCHDVCRWITNDEFRFSSSWTILLGVNGSVLDTDLLEGVVVQGIGNAANTVAAENINVVCRYQLVGNRLGLDRRLWIALCPQQRRALSV